MLLEEEIEAATPSMETQSGDQRAVRVRADVADGRRTDRSSRGRFMDSFVVDGKWQRRWEETMRVGEATRAKPDTSAGGGGGGDADGSRVRGGRRRG
jgi:hypothetical protein